MVGSNSVAATSNPLICVLMLLPTLIFLKARPFTAAIPLTVRVPVLTNWSSKALSPLGVLSEWNNHRQSDTSAL